LYSPVVSTVEAPASSARFGSTFHVTYDGADGGGTWSKNPSFSSKLMKRTVLAHTSGFAVSASSTLAV